MRCLGFGDKLRVAGVDQVEPHELRVVGAVGSRRAECALGHLRSGGGLDGLSDGQGQAWRELACDSFRMTLGIKVRLIETAEGAKANGSDDAEMHGVDVQLAEGQRNSAGG